MARQSRRLLAGLILLLTAACSTGTVQEFDRRMTTYVGRPEADVVAGLGVPSRTYDGDGRRLLQYEFIQPSRSPAIMPGIGFGFGGAGFGIGTGLGLGFGGRPDGCALVFETREGRVTSFNRNGPGCVSTAA